MVALAGLALAAPVAQAHPQPGCGDRVTRDTTLSADLLCGEGQRALTITANHVDLDLNGHQVTGEIAIEGRKRGSIHSGRVGALLLEDADGHRLFGLQVEQGGVQLVDSHGNVVVRNSIFSTPLGSDGALDLVRSDGNRIRRNTITKIEGSAVMLDAGSDRNRLRLNSMIGSQGDGVALAGSWNVIALNQASGGGGGGIENPVGIRVESGHGNRIFGNDARADGGLGLGVEDDGIAVRSPARHTRVVFNTAHDSGDDGIDIDSPGTFVRGNRAERNRDLGIEAASGVRDGGGNRAAGNGNPLQCLNVVCAP